MTILLLGAKSKRHPLESVPAELSRLKQLFSNAPQLQTTVAYEPYLTRSILTEELRRLTDQVSLLHFAGHSSAEQLQADDELVYARHIADILHTWQHKPELLFLNGCNSAEQAKLFLEAGIPCVIATHNYINDHLAALFAYEFYANLLTKPDKVTLAEAFARAGSMTLVSENRAPRSLDIDTIPQASTGSWDWGLFTRDPALPTQWTLATLLQNTPAAPVAALDFITQAKLDGLKTRWQRIYAIHQAVLEQYDHETHIEEKIHMAYVMKKKREDLEAIEKELAAINH